MDKQHKKNITITKKEHDAWHKTHADCGGKMDREHGLCHKRAGIIVKD